MWRYVVLIILLLAATAVLAACAEKGTAASKAFSYACEAGSECAVYMTLANTGREPDALIGAKTDVATRTELHKLSASSRGTLEMLPVENIPLPASDTVELRPGARHLMLVGLTRELKTGDSFALTLLFQSGGEETVQVVVAGKN